MILSNQNTTETREVSALVEKYKISNCAAANLFALLQVYERVFPKARRTQAVKKLRKKIINLIVEGDYKTQTY